MSHHAVKPHNARVAIRHLPRQRALLALQARRVRVSPPLQFLVHLLVSLLAQAKPSSAQSAPYSLSIPARVPSIESSQRSQRGAIVDKRGPRRARGKSE